jgi:hypothetical protein
MAILVRLSDHRRKRQAVFFSRPELTQLLTLYSRQVMCGRWRDYAIDQHHNAVLFSVFRHSREQPTFTIAKFAAGLRPREAYLVLCGHQRLAAASSLAEVLKRLETHLRAAHPINLELYR